MALRIQMCGTGSLKNFIIRQQRHITHIVHRKDDSILKMITFNDDEIHVSDPYNTLYVPIGSRLRSWTSIEE